MKPQVLLVESDTMLRDSLARALRAEDFEVIPAPDPLEALRRLETQHIDLVLLDADAPDRDGWMYAQRIAASQMFLPLVVITAKSGQRLRAAMAGVDALFEKPLSFPALMEALQQFLRQTQAGRLFRLEEAYSAAAS